MHLPLLEPADAFQVQPGIAWGSLGTAPPVLTARTQDPLMEEGVPKREPTAAQKTWFPKAADTAMEAKKWYVVDADGLRLGRLASEVAKILIGKHKPTFTPGQDVGDAVIIINAEKVAVTGKKFTDKLYRRHSGRPGGLKVETFEELQARIPERIVEKAIVGMLPKNSHGRELFRHLKVYKGPDHPHQAQMPEPLTFPNIAPVMPQYMVRGMKVRPKERAAAAQMRMTPEPVMKRMCDLTGKKSNNANRVSFSNKHWAYLQKPNLQTRKLYSPALQKYVKVKIATSTLRTIRKNGLDETAKKYGVDLSKFAVGNVVKAANSIPAPAPELDAEDDEDQGQRLGEVTMCLDGVELLSAEEIAALPDEDEIAVAELLDEQEEEDNVCPAPVGRAGTITMKHKDYFKRVANAEKGRLRLCVFRSNNHIYGQIIDDSKDMVIAAASSLEKDIQETGGQNCDAATVVGKRLAERAKGKGVEKVFFDRNGRPYHGRIAALADGAREGGLDF